MWSPGFDAVAALLTDVYLPGSLCWSMCARGSRPGLCDSHVALTSPCSAPGVPGEAPLQLPLALPILLNRGL